jgi:uncharacterized protein (DUF1330 family)
VQIALYPEADQIAALQGGADDGPVVMLNLLTFETRADAPYDDADGEAVYRRYATRMRAIVEAAGGRFLWAGRVDALVIGRSDVAFDLVGLVEYPSRAAFVRIAFSPEVQQIGEWRAAGLEGQWLVATTPTDV